MREVAELKERIEYMEGSLRIAQHSMRPQGGAKTAGISIIVAGLVAAIAQGIAQAFR
jgi:hypothetical protein